jgi:hypothetical protein
VGCSFLTCEAPRWPWMVHAHRSLIKYGHRTYPTCFLIVYDMSDENEPDTCRLKTQSYLHITKS